MDILNRLEKEGNPLIVRDEATFVWMGPSAPGLIGDFNDWDEEHPVKFEKTSPGIWTHTLHLAQDAYIEYALLDGENRVFDPHNRRRTPNGMGKTNHYFYMPAGSPTNLSRARADIPHGNISSAVLPTHQMVAGKTREVYLYQPPVEQPVPLVVVWDGKEYLRRARLPMIVDNLIAQKRIAPIALALAPNGGVYRFMEYTASEATLVWILSSVLPEAAQKCNLLDLKSHPGAYGVMGASLGGLMSLFAGLRVPDVFGKVLSQSGAFTLREFHTVIWDEVQSSVPIQNHIWMDVGSYEGLLPANREMHQLLIEKDCKHGYHEYSGGHNYPSWRNDVANGLEALFPPID